MAVGSEAIQECHRRASRAWPEIVLSASRFEAHVQRLALSEAALEPHSEDLFLVFAVLEGDPGALAVFERGYLRHACAGAARIDRDAGFLGDVAEQLRLKLMAGPAPALGGYAGATRLIQWLRVAALRTALELKRSQRGLPAQDLPLHQLLEGSSIELAAIEGLHLEDFKRALEESFRRLPTRQRTLLRLHFVEGLKLDAMASIYSVHRATVARWLVAIRRTLFAQTRELLGATHPREDGALRSIYRLLEDELQVTLSSLMMNPPPDPDRPAPDRAVPR